MASASEVAGCSPVDRRSRVRVSRADRLSWVRMGQGERGIEPASERGLRGKWVVNRAQPSEPGGPGGPGSQAEKSPLPRFT